MSHLLYSTCLHWSGKHGFAKMHGVIVALQEAPKIAGKAVGAINYVPEVGVREITLPGAARRDMRDDEVADADELLRKLTV